MTSYCTQYMDAYRSPHESPTGCEGVSVTMVQLKSENKKLRKQLEKQNEELTLLRQQLHYIKVAADVNKPYKKRRPPKLDLSKIEKHF